MWLHQVLSAVDGTKKALLMLIFGALRSVDTRQCQGFTLPLNRFLNFIKLKLLSFYRLSLSVRCIVTHYYFSGFYAIFNPSRLLNDGKVIEDKCNY